MNMPEPLEVSIEEEIADTRMGKPHVLLLGAGASRAALPNGDKRGRPLPLLRDVADDLGFAGLFAEDLRDLARTNFEAAYSRLVERGGEGIEELNSRVSSYFASLELPDIDAVLILTP